MTDSQPTSLLDTLAPVTLLAGQAGVGKTTLTLSLALDAADAGETVTVVDLDVVNPYFRSAEARELLESHEIRLIAPRFSEAGTSLDAPGLTASIGGALTQALAEGATGRLLVDLGGEADGAIALGRYTAAFDAADPTRWALYGVVNGFRPWHSPAEIRRSLAEIESACRLAVSGLINNSHLMRLTDETAWEQGRALAAEVAEAADLPLIATTIPPTLADKPPAQATDSDQPTPELFYPIRSEVFHLWPNQAMI